jgi:DNA-binding NtrC family response regulator
VPTLQVDSVNHIETAEAVLFIPATSRERSVVGERLSRTSVAITPVADAGEALRILSSQPVTLCLVDLADDRTALSTIRALHSQRPSLAIAGIIDPRRPLAAAEAIHAGVADLLPWPFEEPDLAMVVANARDRLSVSEPGPRPEVAADEARLFAHSPAMRLVADGVRAAAEAPGGVLVCGEPGSGRQVVARAIHAMARPDGPFVMVDCRNQDVSALEERLFGAATETPSTNGRRTAERLGRNSAVWEARGGTLLLAHVMDAPTRVQARLARLIRDGEAAFGDKRAALALDLRPVATTEPNPEAVVADGRLRRDLFERLEHVRIDVPPLRRRREDVPLLAVHLLRQMSAARGSTPPRLSRSALALLAALPWPGNGRELGALLELLLQRGSRPVIELDDVLNHVRLDGISPRLEGGGTLRDAKARFERDWITAVLMKHHGRVGDAARALGIQRTNLYRKVRQLNVARSLLGTRKG